MKDEFENNFFFNFDVYNLFPRKDENVLSSQEKETTPLNFQIELPPTCDYDEPIQDSEQGKKESILDEAFWMNKQVEEKEILPLFKSQVLPLQTKNNDGKSC